MKERFLWDVRPLSHENSILAGNRYRFTVLTPSLIRLEYSPDGNFEDRASQVAFYRDFPACEFTCNHVNGEVTVETDALVLRYAEEQPFNEDTLDIRLKIEPASHWRFGEVFETLGGTARTLDQVDGRCPMGDGVCSRNGFSVIDDSESLLLENDGWIGIRNEGNKDVYFFGYGYDYRGAVKALYQLTGAPPLLPAYALGNWWSRYYAYSQQEYLDLMDRFREENIPFSVGVVDMDWHITKIPDALKDPDPRMGGGWTGYSWNKELFPDYKAFLKELHQKNLKTALNLHPAVGTCCHEDMYEEMALANGIDPATKKRVPLNILSKKHMQTYFDILHHPYENDGVDFWWMDWQQGTNYWWIHESNKPGEYQDPRERMDPLWMLNHLHILDISRDGKRPMFFSRYAGPGSHRYPVGFSGDTTISWDSLKFQPEFTATASNVGYSWWSHDIGGHMMGVHNYELYIRWLQLGVFSPINRLHSTNLRFMNKEPWNYPSDIALIAGNWLRMRHSLFPYIYTMNYRNHRELLPLVQPMYYSYPKSHEAYKATNQYLFGSELMVSPITEPNDPSSMCGRAEVWFPEGCWFDFFTGLRYDALGGRRMNVYRTLDKMPVFAKEGAIVPMAIYAERDNRLTNSAEMQVLVFPGKHGRFEMYEDAGEGNGYQDGAFCVTSMELKWDDNCTFTIYAAQGDRRLIPGHRKWKIGFRGFHKDALIAGSTWDAETNTHWLTVEADTDKDISVSICGEHKIHDNADVLYRCEASLRLCQLSHLDKTRLWDKLFDNAYNRKPTLRGRVVALLGTSYAAAKPLVELITLTDDPFIGK